MMFKKKRLLINTYDFPPPPPQIQIVREEPRKNHNYFAYSVVVLVVAIASSGSFFAAWIIKPEQPQILYEPQTLGVSDTPQSSLITPLPVSDSGEIKLVTLESISTNDGYVTSRGQVVDKSDIKIGRDDKEVSRGFVSFDLSQIPNRSQISTAKLKLFEVETVGVPLRLSPLLVDQLTYGESLDKEDYSVASILSNIATLTKDNRTKWYEADVTFAVKEDKINSRPSSQFRIHFEKEVLSDDSTDAIYFESSDNKSRSGKLPQLEVEYF